MDEYSKEKGTVPYVLASVCFCVCVCAFVECVNTTVRAVSEPSRYDIISTADLGRGALQLKLLGRKCTNDYASITLQLMVFGSICALA